MLNIVEVGVVERVPHVDLQRHGLPVAERGARCGCSARSRRRVAAAPADPSRLREPPRSDQQAAAVAAAVAGFEHRGDAFGDQERIALGGELPVRRRRTAASAAAAVGGATCCASIVVEVLRA